MKVVTTAEMSQIETRAYEEFGFNEETIIENVGLRGADFLYRQFLSKRSFGEIVVLVGKGNNGADGLSIARHLCRFGLSIRAFMTFSEEEWGESLRKQFKIACAFGVKTSELKNADQLEAYYNNTQENYFVVDALFGTGVRLPLSNKIFDIIKTTNDFAQYIVSIDIASGVVGDTGEVGAQAIKATHTLAIGLPKLGHYVSNGPQLRGDLTILDAGFPNKLLEQGEMNLLTLNQIKKLYKKRNKFAHKNRFGHALVIGGSHGLTGALSLASEAALKVGTGLVTAVTWKDSFQELVPRVIPELMLGTIPQDENSYKEEALEIQKYNSIIIGPGLGKGEKARNVVLDLLSIYDGPLILDADAINVLDLKQDLEILKLRKSMTLLTPHMGEFSRLIDVDVSEIIERPIHYLRNTIDNISCSILLKGACSYIGFPNGIVSISYYPNDGMATGGSGDVLAGILGGLLAQTSSQLKNVSDGHHSIPMAFNPGFYEAAGLGVGLHSLAGKHAAKVLGGRSMTARSLVNFLPQAFFEIGSPVEVDTLNQDYDYHQALEESSFLNA